MVQVELVYVAVDGKSFTLRMDLQQGATVADALEQSKITYLHPETQGLPVGIYAKQVDLNAVLNEGDRVEIYRPLTLDPKEKRRQRAREPRGQ